MFKVKKKMCGECLYTKNRIVSSDRAKEIMASCERTGSHFSCHKGTIDGKDICCRGFFDTSSTNLIRAAVRLGAVEFID